MGFWSTRESEYGIRFVILAIFCIFCVWNGVIFGKKLERNRILQEGVTLRELEVAFNIRRTAEEIYYNGRWRQMPPELREQVRRQYEHHNPMKREFSDEEYELHFCR
jgi:hypothetical protein